MSHWHDVANRCETDERAEVIRNRLDEIDPRELIQAFDVFERQEFFDRLKAEAQRLGVRV